MEAANSEIRRVKKTFRQRMNEEVVESWADVVLIVCCFLTGLLDSAVFNAYSCFISMQTGNTLYLGLGASGQPASQPYRWAKSGFSILCFMLGAFCFSRLCRWLGPVKRGTVIASFFAQAVLIYAAAALIETDLVPGFSADGPHINWLILIPLGLLAFQAGGQIVMSRLLGFSGTPTVVLTSTYCDLMMDAQLFTAPLHRDASRNRRVCSIVAVVLGAVAGGFLDNGRYVGNALWTGGAVKFIIAATWYFWKPKGGISLD